MRTTIRGAGAGERVVTPLVTLPRARPHRADLPGLHRLRGVLLVFCVLTGTGADSGAPTWTWLVLAATAAAVPGAVALRYGGSAVRALLGLPPRPCLRDESVPPANLARPK